MTTEDFVNFETAKLLKEKGFNVFVPSYYDIDGKLINGVADWNYNAGSYNCSAPTLQMAMKWLREVHNIYIQIMLDGWALGGHMGYYVVIQKIDSDFEIMLQDYCDEVFYKTYEEACEAAIKYCLENLI